MDDPDELEDLLKSMDWPMFRHMKDLLKIDFEADARRPTRYWSTYQEFEAVLRPEVPHVGDASKISLPENIEKGVQEKTRRTTTTRRNASSDLVNNVIIKGRGVTRAVRCFAYPPTVRPQRLHHPSRNLK